MVDVGGHGTLDAMQQPHCADSGAYRTAAVAATRTATEMLMSDANGNGGGGGVDDTDSDYC